jgi:hypothetical protein
MAFSRQHIEWGAARNDSVCCDLSPIASVGGVGAFARCLQTSRTLLSRSSQGLYRAKRGESVSGDRCRLFDRAGQGGESSPVTQQQQAQPRERCRLARDRTLVGSYCPFWRVCERAGDGPTTAALNPTLRDQAAAHQVNSLGFAIVSKKRLRNLCCRKAGMARDEILDRVCHRDKVPAIISPTRYRSVTNLRVGHPSALHGTRLTPEAANRSDKRMGHKTSR